MSHKNIFKVMENLKSGNVSFAIATIIAVKGSTSAKPGDKAIYDEKGKRIVGYIGGGCVENRVGQTVVESLVDNKTRIINVNLDSDDMQLGIPCGGMMTVFVEPQYRSQTILIRGMGRVVEVLSELAATLNFKVLIQTQVDEKDRYDSADLIFTDPLDLDEIDESVDYFILVTHHRDDHHQSLSALNHGIPFVAVIASQKKAGMILDYLKENNVADEFMANFHSPAGLDLNAQTAEEIALSIMSEIVMHRNSGSGEAMGK
ncbi:MAG: XdhC family protein [Candidatus Marinimicrobia bacterium]|nr:XdhC family protein [Candidatus Neomarinimicrobiota bacterium]MBT6391448.1 XdhC family protein [Candidatus Neomarinimicrobiota bacterium]